MIVSIVDRMVTPPLPPAPPRAIRACLGLALAAALGLPPGAAAQTASRSSNFLVLDIDAGYVNDSSAGALLNVNRLAGTSTLPYVEASADSGAPFEYLSGMAISPITGKVYVSDQGVAPTNTPRIFSIDGVTGAVEIIAEGAPMVQPFGLAFLPDGRLVIADPEANVTGLGPTNGCGTSGDGALFVLDVDACMTPPCLPTVLSDGRRHSLGGGLRSAYGDPLAVAYDAVTDRLYVADACFSPLGWSGSVYAVDVVTGQVDLISSSDEYAAIISLDVMADGTVLMIDQGVTAGDSMLFKIDAGNPDPETNWTYFSGGTQYSTLQDVTSDAAGEVYVVDWGEYDSSTDTWIQFPGVYRVDQANPVYGTNGVLVNESSALVTPIGIEAVPVPIATSVTPSAITGTMNVIIEGSSLFESVTLDFGPNIRIGSVAVAPGRIEGTALQVNLTVTGGSTLPAGCAGDTPLSTTSVFGGTGVLANAIQVTFGSSGIVREPPFSTRGDANADGVVDGFDLAIVGTHFGRTYCEGVLFWNNADFNNDDIIDGIDLARLVQYFGTGL